MIGDRSLNENNANTQVGTPDQMVDPITKEIGIIIGLTH